MKKIVHLIIAKLYVLAALVDGRTLRSVHKHGPKDTRPNIVWVLADDLHYEEAVLEQMPNLRRMRKEGLEFPNHVSQSPLCGPSRASLLVGRFPHNTGYRNNAADDSVSAFEKIHNMSIGKWLTDAGYYTAFLGKYVNRMAGKIKETPTGWNYFGGLTGEWDPYKQKWIGGTYNYYNASQWDLEYDETGTNLIKKNNSDYPINFRTGIHQADFLASQTIDHAKKGIDMGKPFFVFTNPAMVHHGYCQGPFKDSSEYAADDPWREEFEVKVAISPCAKKERTEAFLTSKFGEWRMHSRSPAWNTTAVGMKKTWPTCCNNEDITRLKYGAQNRTGSMVDLDDMLGFIMQGLAKLNVLDNTYFFFTSDNGFHMGEHKFLYGKELPYDHDTRVPFVVRVPKGVSTGVRHLPTSHIDITRTIVDLANAHSVVTPSLAVLDGKSFADAFEGDVKVADWRRWSFSEMFESKGKTWRSLRYIGDNGHVEWTLNLWCTGDVEVFHEDAEDPDQLLNVLAPEAGKAANEFGQDIVDKWVPVLNGMGECAGNSCSNAQEVRKELGSSQLSELMACTEE